jgi:hypothetical protein
MKMPVVDFQCSAILEGLRNLESVLDKPLAIMALSVRESALAAQRRESLGRLRRSLAQYLDREGDLIYFGFIGHFSSGKSSTINALLNLSGTADERPTDLHPTDKVITLVTQPSNANALLGVAGQGSVPIRVHTVERPFVRHCVIADTPGTGDPHLLEAMARDFLPICDMVLFFFASTSPLDETDLPLLRELHKKLPFIPIRFVVTRADELRLDRSTPLTEENFDSPAAAKFLVHVISRMAQLADTSRYTAADFWLIDTKAGFRIAELRDTLNRSADPSSASSRLTMHSHKVQYFRTGAMSLKAFFGSVLEDKLLEVTRIVSSAEKNIQRYNENVHISNNNLTKSWLEHYQALRAIRAEAVKSQDNVPILPASWSQLDDVKRDTANLDSAIDTLAQRVTEKIKRHVISTDSVLVKEAFARFIKDLDHIDMDVVTPHSHGIRGVHTNWTFESDAEMWTPFYFAKLLDDQRSALKVSLNAVAGDVRRHIRELLDLIERATIVGRCELIVEAAQSALRQDLETYFQNVHVYRTGVFSMATKGSIAKLGIGHELDQIEKEFTEDDKAALLRRANSDLFTSADEIIVNASSRLRELLDRTKALDQRAVPLRLDAAPSVNDVVNTGIAESSRSVVEWLKHELDKEIAKLVEKAQSDAAAAIAKALAANGVAIEAAYRRRRLAYIVATVTGGALAVGFYLAYRYLSVQAGNSITSVMGWGVLSNIIGDLCGLAVAKWRDEFPARHRTIRETSKTNLVTEIRKSVNFLLDNIMFRCLAVDVLKPKIKGVYNDVRNQLRGDSWSELANMNHEELRRLFEERRRLGLEYVTIAETLTDQAAGYFQDPDANLKILHAISTTVKDQAIEPSFQLLKKTSDQLDEVKREIDDVSFG